MEKMKKIGLFFVVILMIVFFVLFNTDVVINDGKEEIKRVSLIMAEKRGVDLDNFRKGIQEAANDDRVDVNYIVLDEDEKEEDILMHLRREYEGGAQAMIILGEGDGALRRFFEEQNKSLPVVAVNTGEDYGEESVTVSFEMKETAKLLCKEIKSRQGEKSKVVLLTNGRRLTEQTCRILEESFQEMGIRTEKSTMSEKAVQGYLEDSEEALVFVACCASAAEEAAKLLEGQPLYGIGYSNEILEYIREKKITGVMAYSMYSMGIYAMQEAAKAIENGGKADKIMVPCRWITEENRKAEYEFLFPVY